MSMSNRNRSNTTRKKQIYPIRHTRLERDTVHHPSKIQFLNEMDLDSYIKPDVDKSFEKLIEVMKIESSKRNHQDIHIIMKYLIETEIMNKFKADREIMESSFDSLMWMCATYLNLVLINKNEILFRIDDIGDKFYILIKGTVAVLKPIENKKVKMTTQEYFNHLTMLRSKEERYLLNKTMRANLEVLNIKDQNDFDRIFSYMLKKKFKSNPELFHNIDDINHIFSQFFKKIEDFGIDVRELEKLTEREKEGVEGLIQRYLEKKLRITTDEILLFNKYMDLPKKDEKEVVTFTYQKFMYLHAGQYFGDFALDHINKKRTATIRAEDDCILGFLSNEVYDDHIKTEKQKIKTKEMAFLNDNFFLYPIKPFYFELKYFSHFAPHTYARGHHLYSEGGNADRVVFVKEGQIETSYYGSLIDLHNLIRQIVARYFNFINDTTNYSLNIDKKDLAYLKQYLHDDSLTKLRNKSNKYIRDINTKRKIHISLISSKDMCGVEDLCLGFISHFCKATVHTEKAKVYYLNVEKLKYIFENEKNCISPYFKFANSKIISLIKRLNHIKRTYTEMHLVQTGGGFEEDEIFSTGVNLHNSFSATEFKHPDAMKILKHEINVSGIGKSFVRDEEALVERNEENDGKYNRLNKTPEITFKGSPKVEKFKSADSSLRISRKINLKHSLKKSLFPEENIANSGSPILEGKESSDNNILANLNKKKDEKLFYDSSLLDKVKFSLEKFKSQSIVVNSKSNEVTYFNLPNTKGSLFLTGQKHEERANDEKTERYMSNSNRETKKTNKPRINRGGNIYNNTKVSFLNLFDYENSTSARKDNEGDQGFNINLKRSFHNTSPPQIPNLKNTLLTNNIKSMQKSGTQTNLTKGISDNKESEMPSISPSNSTTLPFVTKYKIVNESKMKKTKKNNCKELLQNVKNMVTTFHYNLNKSKFRYSVRSVKSYHDEQKQKGYGRFLTPSNSLIKMKVNNQL